MTPADSDWTDVGDDGDGELAVAPTFAARRSRRPALQETKVGAQPNRTRKQSPNVAGLSLLLTHPIILRDLPPHTDARPSQAELTRLHRTLTQRDLVILQSLYDYRYLNTLQVKGTISGPTSSAATRFATTAGTPCTTWKPTRSLLRS